MKSLILMLLAIALVLVLAVPALILNTIRKAFRKENIKHYFKMVSWGFDQVGGSILYAQEDWMVSSWTYYLWRNSDGANRWAYRFMVFINTLFMDKDHCKDSFYAEAKRLNFKTEWM